MTAWDRGFLNRYMIESISDIDKQQYIRTASFFQNWLAEHPHVEEDDDFHRMFRVSANTYLSMYSHFVQMYAYIVKIDYIDPKNKTIH